MKWKKQHRNWLGLALGFLLFGGCVFLSACQSGLEVKVERYEGDLILEERMQFARIQAVGREATETLIRHFEVAASSVTPEREGDDLSPPSNLQGPHSRVLQERWEKFGKRAKEYVRSVIDEAVAATAERQRDAAKALTESEKAWTEAAKAWTEAAKAWTEAAKAWTEAAKAWTEVPSARVQATKAWIDATKAWVKSVKDQIETVATIKAAEAAETPPAVEAALQLASPILTEIAAPIDLRSTYWNAYDEETNGGKRVLAGLAALKRAVGTFDNDEGTVAQRLGRLQDARRRYLEVRDDYLLDRGLSRQHNFGALAEDIWRVLHWAITYSLWANAGNTYRQMTRDSFLRFAAQFGAEARAAIRRTSQPRGVILTDLDKGWLDPSYREDNASKTPDSRLAWIRAIESARAEIEKQLFSGEKSPEEVGERLATLDNAIYALGSTPAGLKSMGSLNTSTLDTSNVDISAANAELELNASGNRAESLTLVRKWLQNASGSGPRAENPHYMSIAETIGGIRTLIEHSALFKPETSNSLNNEMLMTGMGHFAEQLNSLRAAVEHTDPALTEYAVQFKRYVDGLAEKEQRRSVWSTASSVNRYGRPVFNPNGSQYHTLLYEVWRVSAGNYQRISSLANFIMRSDRLKHHVPSELPAEIGKHNHKYRRGGTSHQREFRNEQWHRILEAEQLVANAIRDGIITQSGRPQTIKELGEPELEVLREAVRGLYREQLARHEATDGDLANADKALFNALFRADLPELSKRLREAKSEDGSLQSAATLTEDAGVAIRDALRPAAIDNEAIIKVLNDTQSWRPAPSAPPKFTVEALATLIDDLRGKDIGQLYQPIDSSDALTALLAAKGFFWPNGGGFITPLPVWDTQKSVTPAEAEILIKPMREAALAYLTDKTALRNKILPAWVNLLLPAHSDTTPVASSSVRRISAWQGEDLASLREALVPLWDIHGMRVEALSDNQRTKLATYLAHLWVIERKDLEPVVKKIPVQLKLPSVSGISDDTGLRMFQNATASLVKKSEGLIFNIELLRTAQEALEFLRYMESPYIGVRPLGDYLSLDTAAAEAYGMSYDPWHTISTTFVRASTNADYVVMRDMNGNWQVKATKNDPTELINFIYGAALAAIEIATNAASGGTTGSSSALTGALTQHGKSLIENAQAGRVNTWAMQELVDAYGEFYAKETKIVDDRIATLTNELDGDKSITDDQVAKATDEASKQALRDKQKGLVARANEVDGSTPEGKAKKDQLLQQVKGKRQDLVAAYKARQAFEQEYDRFLSNAHSALLSSNAAADVPADGGKAEAAKGGIPKGTSPLDSLVK